MDDQKTADRFRFIPGPVVHLALALINPLARFLVSWHVTANQLTLLGLILTVAATPFIYFGYFFWAGILIFFGGLCDWLDGTVARLSSTCSVQGALLDSFVDRISDMVPLAALIMYFVQSNIPICALVTAIALFGTVETAIIKKEGESVGVRSCVGLLQRQHRILLLTIGLMIANVHSLPTSLTPLLEYPVGRMVLAEWPLMVFMMVLAILTNVTAMQRTYSIFRAVRQYDSTARPR